MTLEIKKQQLEKQLREIWAEILDHPKARYILTVISGEVHGLHPNSFSKFLSLIEEINNIENIQEFIELQDVINDIRDSMNNY